MSYKKFNLYLDNKNKQWFREKDVSEDELEQIEFGFIIKQRLLDGIDFSKSNPEQKPYILLLKKVNNLRQGNPNIYNRTIYFDIKNKDVAKRELIASFENILKGRDIHSLQNLGFLTEENLVFVEKLKDAKKEIIVEDESDLEDDIVLTDKEKNKNKEGKK